MSARFFGQYLLEIGVITAPQLLAGLEHQRRKGLEIDQLAIARGLLTEEQAQKVRAEERASGLQFGEACSELGLLSAEEVVALYAEQQRQRIPLGEALVAVGALTPEALEKNLNSFHGGQEKERIEVEKSKLSVSELRLPVPSAIVEATSHLLQRIARIPTKESTSTRCTGIADARFLFGATVKGDWEGHFFIVLPDVEATQVATEMLDDWPGSIPREIIGEALIQFVSSVGARVKSASKADGDDVDVLNCRQVGADEIQALKDQDALHIPLLTLDDCIDLYLVAGSG